MVFCFCFCFLFLLGFMFVIVACLVFVVWCLVFCALCFSVSYFLSAYNCVGFLGGFVTVISYVVWVL